MLSNDAREASATRVLLEDLRVARAAVSLAEAELDKAVAQLTTAPRSMKTTMSTGLHSVFASLRSAKETLALLEQTALTNS